MHWPEEFVLVCFTTGGTTMLLLPWFEEVLLWNVDVAFKVKLLFVKLLFWIVSVPLFDSNV